MSLGRISNWTGVTAYNNKPTSASAWRAPMESNYHISNFTGNQSTQPYSFTVQPGTATKNTTAPATSYSSGGYSGGYSGGTSDSSTAYNPFAQVQSLMAQRLAAQRQATAEANALIEQQRDADIGDIEAQGEKNKRGEYVQYERAKRDLPQTAAISGGGGLSETALLGMNSEYGNARNEITELTTQEVGDLKRQAAAAIASNNANLATATMDTELAMAEAMMNMGAFQGGDYGYATPTYSGGASYNGVSPVVNMSSSGMSTSEKQRQEELEKMRQNAMRSATLGYSARLMGIPEYGQFRYTG